MHIWYKKLQQTHLTSEETNKTGMWVRQLLYHVPDAEIKSQRKCAGSLLSAFTLLSVSFTITTDAIHPNTYRIIPLCILSATKHCRLCPKIIKDTFWTQAHFYDSLQLVNWQKSSLKVTGLTTGLCVWGCEVCLKIWGTVGTGKTKVWKQSQKIWKQKDLHPLFLRGGKKALESP